MGRVEEAPAHALRAVFGSVPHLWRQAGCGGKVKGAQLEGPWGDARVVPLCLGRAERAGLLPRPCQPAVSCWDGASRDGWMNPKPQNKEGKAHSEHNEKSQRGLSSRSSSQGLGGGSRTEPGRGLWDPAHPGGSVFPPLSPRGNLRSATLSTFASELHYNRVIEAI